MAKDYMKARMAGDYGYDYKRSDRYAKMPKGEMSELKDGTQAGHVYGIDTEAEKYDMGRIRYDSVGMKGYPRQAFEYDY